MRLPPIVAFQVPSNACDIAALGAAVSIRASPVLVILAGTENPSRLMSPVISFPSADTYPLNGPHKPDHYRY